MIFIFFNPFAITAILIISAASYGLCIKQPRLLIRLNETSQLSFFASFTLSLVWAIHTLANLPALEQIGPALSFCLLLPLYAAAMRTFVLAAVRIFEQKA